MKSFPRKPFYLVRHGESFANRFEYPSGRMDTRLTRLGWDQAREAALIAARLDEKPAVVVASALVRARETAKLIQAGMDCALKIDRHLGEQFYGRVEFGYGDNGRIGGINFQRRHAGVALRSLGDPVLVHYEALYTRPEPHYLDSTPPAD